MFISRARAAWALRWRYSPWTGTKARGRITFRKVRSSSWAPWPETWMGALSPWKTRAPRRSRPLITRDMRVSLPGMGRAEMRTVSPSSMVTQRWSPEAISDRAAKGSPWDPVQTTAVRCAGWVSTSSMGITASGGSVRVPRASPMATLRCIERPRKAT